MYLEVYYNYGNGDTITGDGDLKYSPYISKHSNGFGDGCIGNQEGGGYGNGWGRDDGTRTVVGNPFSYIQRKRLPGLKCRK